MYPFTAIFEASGERLEILEPLIAENQIDCNKTPPIFQNNKKLWENTNAAPLPQKSLEWQLARLKKNFCPLLSFLKI